VSTHTLTPRERQRRFRQSLAAAGRRARRQKKIARGMRRAYELGVQRAREAQLEDRLHRRVLRALRVLFQRREA
jgi:hypothetical protein